MTTEGKVMNEVVKFAIATEDEAVAWIAKALDEGDFAKEAECYRLVRRFGLDLETISAAWNEKRARLAADRARLTDLSARLAKFKPKIDALKAAEEPETLTALPAQNNTKTLDEERPAASKPKRRSLAPDPSEAVAKSEADLSFIFYTTGSR
jgi:hypothetical protein